MIFGKGKKDSQDKSFKRPLESAAINRWRSIESSRTEENNEKYSSEEEDTPAFSFSGKAEDRWTFTDRFADKFNTTKEGANTNVNYNSNNEDNKFTDSFRSVDNDPNEPFLFSPEEFSLVEELDLVNSSKSEEDKSSLNLSKAVEFDDVYEDDSEESEDVSEDESAFSMEDVLDLDEEHYSQPEEENLGASISSENNFKSSSISSHQSVIQKPIHRTEPGDFNIPVDQDISQRFGTNLKSALGAGTVIEGMFSFENPVKIDGILRGEIKSTSALIVGPGAKVSARIQVGSLIVLGTVEGEIEAQDLIEIRKTGTLEGEVVARRLALEEGGVFNGACTMIE